MKKFSVVSILCVFMVVTILGNLPKLQAKMVYDHDGSINQSVMLEDVDMKGIEGGSIAGCLIGIGTAVRGILYLAAGDFFDAAITYGAGIYMITHECVL